MNEPMVGCHITTVVSCILWGGGGGSVCGGGEGVGKKGKGNKWNRREGVREDWEKRAN